MKCGIILISVLTFISINGITCVGDDDFYTVQLLQLGGKFIYASKSFKLNWYQAMEYCASHGLRLLTIKTAEENFLLAEFLKDYVPKINSVWTSGTDLGEEGKWIWMSTGDKFRYTNWSENQPDNYTPNDQCESENCLGVGYTFDDWRTFDYMFWNDDRCSKKQSFICEQYK